jgi:ABC-type transporter Mla subunit MlaD
VRWFLLLSVLVLAGCRHAGHAHAATPAADPDQALYDQIQRGSFNLTAAVSDLDTLRRGLKDLEAKVPAGDMKETLEDDVDEIDGVGKDIADFTAEPPPFDVFKKQVSTFRQRLKDALQKTNDALVTFDDAWGDVDSMSDAAPKNLQTQLDDLGVDMENVDDDLKNAIREMGGTPPNPGDDES